MKTISVICPSRGRPERWAEMVDSVYRTASHPERVTVEVMIDADDHRVADYVNNARLRCSIFVNGEGRKSAPALYDALAKAAGGELLIAAADDVVFRTPGWDVACDRLFAEFPDGLAVGYFNDGRNRDKVEHFITSAAWVKAIGYFMFGGYEHFSADEHVGEIARLAGRLRHLPTVILEHLHFKYGKAVKDETYAEKRRDPVHLRDASLFRSMTGERHAAAALIRKEIDARAAA